MFAGGKLFGGRGAQVLYQVDSGGEWATLVAGDSVFFRGGQRLCGDGDDSRGLEGCAAGRCGLGPLGVLRRSMAGIRRRVVLYDSRWDGLSGLRLVGAGRKTGNVKDGLSDRGLFGYTGRAWSRSRVFRSRGLLIYGSGRVVVDRTGYSHGEWVGGNYGGGALWQQDGVPGM